MSPLVRLIATIALAPLAVVTASACATPEAARPATASVKVGQSVELALPDLQGKTQYVIAAAKGKVLVLDFWATWCEPCRASMPEYDALYRRLGPKGLEVVGVSVDEDGRKIGEFVQKAGVSFPIVWDRGAEQTSEKFALNRIPTTVVLDKTGRIRSVHDGYTGSDMVEALEREVVALLAEAP